MISHLELTEALEQGRISYVQDKLNSMPRDRAIMMCGALGPWLLERELIITYDIEQKVGRFTLKNLGE